LRSISSWRTTFCGSVFASSSFPFAHSSLTQIHILSRQKKFPFRHFIGHAILDPFERHQGATPMEWTTPKHEEIDLNCEISSYANAEL